MPAPTLSDVSTLSSTAVAADSLSVSPPANIVQNDVRLVLFATACFGGTVGQASESIPATHQTPSGWDAIVGGVLGRDLAAGGNTRKIRWSLFAKRAGASEAAVTFAHNNDWGGSVSDRGSYAYTFRAAGVGTSGPLSAYFKVGTHQIGTDATAELAALVTDYANSRVIGFANAADDVGINSATAPSGMSWSQLVNLSTAVGSDVKLIAYSGTLASAGASTGATGGLITWSASQVWSSLFVALTEQADVTAPTADVTAGPTPSKISGVSGFDDADITFTVSEACQAWELRKVAASGDARGSGVLVKSGGAVASSQDVTVTYADLVAAGVAGADGALILKVFVRDLVGNWSA